MNGQTNVQISAIATFVSVTILWLAGYFLPDLMNTAPEMLGEIFTGALIVVFGLIFKPDAGIKALPGTGTPQSSVFVGLLLLLMLVVGGCGIQAPRVSSVSDSIAVTAVGIETAADQIGDMCGNQEPGGNCLPGALISTASKNRLKESLGNAVGFVSSASDAVAAKDSHAASDQLARARAILTVVQREIEERQQ